MHLFIDTSAFVALADRADQFHAIATGFYKTLSPHDALVTSNFVLDETITRLRFTIGASAALKWARELHHSAVFHVEHVTSQREMDAVAIMEKYRDHPLSFTDCTNLVLMRELKITEIFAFDDDFRKVGYRVVP